MTYYYLFIILFMVIAWLVEAVRKNQIRHFLKASGVCIVGALIGVCLNLSNLYHTWQYSQESMRGKSELVKKNSANQTSSGLERDYITQDMDLTGAEYKGWCQCAAGHEQDSHGSCG